MLTRCTHIRVLGDFTTANGKVVRGLKVVNGEDSMRGTRCWFTWGHILKKSLISAQNVTRVSLALKTSKFTPAVILGRNPISVPLRDVTKPTATHQIGSSIHEPMKQTNHTCAKFQGARRGIQIHPLSENMLRPLNIPQPKQRSRSMWKSLLRKIYRSLRHITLKTTEGLPLQINPPRTRHILPLFPVPSSTKSILPLVETFGITRPLKASKWRRWK